MTLPGSGQLDYNSIRAEFAGPSSNVTLSTYYRGSAYTYPVAANANITTSSSGQISVSNFHGAMGTAHLALGTCQTHTTGGKLSQTNRGLIGSAWTDNTGYWGGQNIGTWQAIYSLVASFGVVGAAANWTTAISASPAGVIKGYNSSGTQLIQCDRSATWNGSPSSWVTWAHGYSGANDLYGGHSPAAASWPTSGDMYIQS